MQPLLALTTTLATLCVSVLSIPSNEFKPIDPAGSQPYTRSEEERYYLKTEVKFPNPLHRFASNKDNLYLTLYHTGAGLADAVFDADKSRAYPGYLRNDTRFVFPIGLDWFLGLDYPRPYEMWHPVRYSAAGLPTMGFFFNGTKNLECKPGNVPDSLYQWQG